MTPNLFPATSSTSSTDWYRINTDWDIISTHATTMVQNTLTTANTIPISSWQMTGYVTGDLPRTPPLEFNRYVNASDLLEEFIRFAGEEGVRQGEVLGLPIELFVKWLIIKACEHDQEEPNVTLEIPSRPPQPRCCGCQRFMRRGTVLPLHGRRCAAHLFARTEKIAVA